MDGLILELNQSQTHYFQLVHLVGYGHVLYIEAVDYINKVYYASEAGGGYQWGGINKYSFDAWQVNGKNYGFIYLSETLKK